MAIVNTHYGYCGGSKVPGLAGTWMFNDRLEKPTKILMFDGDLTWGDRLYTQMEVDPASYLYVNAGGNKSPRYRFRANSWLVDDHKVQFHEGATASDEFRAWLESNATKQS